MFWTWNAVTHVILLQVALAFYVLIWPLLKSFAAWASREFARRYPSDTAAETVSAGAKRPYRGKWRDTQYQRGERASKAEWQEYRKRRSQAANGTMALKSKHLRVLGLSEPVHLLDIKKAYRQMARDFHPDKFVSEQHSDDKRAAAAARMREVNAAYDWLRSNT
ncbi:MAG: J domain-containing protein [Pseudomonadota bacterium]